MPEKPNNFWQELKRRKVIRVIIGYSAAAYVILELTSIIAEPLGLPGWTINFVLALLCIGFIITVVGSWIYDFTIKGIEKTKPEKAARESEAVSEPAKKKLKVSDIIIAILLVVVIILVYPKMFKPDNLEQLRSKDEITIAVMPFQNMTGDTTWNIWQEGIQNELITSLSNSEELKVRQTGTINSIIRSRGITNYASIAPSFASAISQKLRANVLVYGSITQAGNVVRVNSQLINPKNEEVIKSFQIEKPGRKETIFNIIDSLSTQVKNFLIISKLKDESPVFGKYTYPTNSPDAYRYYMYGQKAFFNLHYRTAIDYYLKAINIDSSFYSPIIMLSVAYFNISQLDKAKEWCLKVYEKRNQMDIRNNIHLSWLYSLYFETPNEEIRYCNQMLELDDQNPPIYYELGRIYVALNQYDKATGVMTKVFDIYKKWDSKPRWVNDYIMLGFSYHKTGEYKKEKKLYKKAEKDFPDIFSITQRQAILALTEKDTVAANQYIEKFLNFVEGDYPEVSIMFGLAWIYTEGGYLDEAEECYRKAISLEPENPSCLNNLGWFLIHEDRNIEEGMELMDKALTIKPKSYLYLDNKGEGLYKQGKYNKALELLQKSWDLRLEKAVYNHEAFLRLEAARKAVAEQN